MPSPANFLNPFTGNGFNLLKASTSLFMLGVLSTVLVQAQTASSASGSPVLRRTAELKPVEPDLVTLSSLPDAPLPFKSESLSSLSAPNQASGFASTTPSASHQFPPFRQRERNFISDLLGPTAFIAPAFQAGIDSARPLKVSYPSDGYSAPGQHPAHGDVPEWGEGAQGYAKRYADRFGQGLVSTTTRYALGEALRQDVTYHRCDCNTVFSRTAHAFAGAYLAHTRSGRAVPSLPALASPFVASEVALNAWYPGRYNTSDALRVSVLNYVAAPFRNLFTEFFAK